MNRLRGISVILGVCAALAATSAWAEGSPFVGRWHWNRAQSTLPAGEAVPHDLTSEISRADTTHMNWTVTILTAEGRPHVEIFDALADGEFHPISSDTTVSFRLTDDTLLATFHGSAGQSDAQTCTISADQKQMTCRGVLTNGDGTTASYVDVYDRM